MAFCCCWFFLFVFFDGPKGSMVAACEGSSGESDGGAAAVAGPRRLLGAEFLARGSAIIWPVWSEPSTGSVVTATATASLPSPPLPLACYLVSSLFSYLETKAPVPVAAPAPAPAPAAPTGRRRRIRRGGGVGEDTWRHHAAAILFPFSRSLERDRSGRVLGPFFLFSRSSSFSTPSPSPLFFSSQWLTSFLFRPLDTSELETR